MIESRVVEWGTYETAGGPDLEFNSTVELPEHEVPIHEDYKIEGVPFAWATLQAKTDGLWMKTTHPMPSGLFLTPVVMTDGHGMALRVISLALSRVPPLNKR